jgi:hypothetical protein
VSEYLRLAQHQAAHARLVRASLLRLPARRHVTEHRRGSLATAGMGKTGSRRLLPLAVLGIGTMFVLNLS